MFSLMKLSLLCLAQFLWTGITAGQYGQTGISVQPNIVMIISDDQDLQMNSLAYQPMVQKYFRDQGTSFARHYCTIAQCCPARVSLLTGKAAHNTNVTDVRLPYGKWPLTLLLSEDFN